MNKHRYLPSLDALRAIAVLSVIVYHINPNYLPGGFLGVDLFFVLSGYLITSLILNEYQEHNRVNFIKFYIKRARRLLPAVYVMISLVLVFMVVFNNYLLEKSYIDALYAYIYSSNWWYIFNNLDYFDNFVSASPYKHLWSLAIEEQFYLLFPLLFLFLSKLNVKKDKLSIFKYALICLAVVSLGSHIFMFDINSINRVYYGSDTRMFELLIGAIFSIIFPMESLSEKMSKKDSDRYVLVAGISTLIFIVSMFFVTEYSVFLYYGGFLLYALLFAVIIISVGHQQTKVSRIFSFKPLVYIGKISYSLYLWHFPVIILTTVNINTDSTNIIANIFRLFLIFVLAILSYQYIETPIRKKGFVYCIKYVFNHIITFSKIKFRIFLSGVITFVLLFIMGIFGKALPFVSTAFVSDNRVQLNDSLVTENKEYQLVENSQNEEKLYRNLLLIGDSLGVNVGNVLLEKYPGSVIDSRISRQMSEAITVADKYADLNRQHTAVIFIIGTNGTITEAELKTLLDKFNHTDIYFVNSKVPRIWEKQNNKLLEEAKDQYSNLKILDWHQLATNHPEYFSADKVHINNEGISAMIDLISSNLKYEVKTNKMQEIENSSSQVSNP